MSISKTLIVALLCSGVGAATAQQSGLDNQRRTTDYQNRTQHDSSVTSDSNLMQKIRVVEKDVIDKDLTANNVIGEEVYGTDGEQIGKIHDLKLEGKNFTQLRQQFLTSKRDWNGDANRDVSERTADSVERTGDRVADSVERAGERTADAIDRSQDRSSDTLDRADRTADRVDRSADRAADQIDRTTEQAQRDLEQSRDAWTTTDSMGQEGSSQLYAVIQTGGVLGIGSDYFVVPFDQLRYDAAEERFQLAITQSQLEQIRERPTNPSASL